MLDTLHPQPHIQTPPASASLLLSQVILSESSMGAEVPFFETWMQTCMPEEGKILNPDHPCFRPDSTKVESLVALLNNSSEMKLVSVRGTPAPRVGGPYPPWHYDFFSTPHPAAGK